MRPLVFPQRARAVCKRPAANPCVESPCGALSPLGHARCPFSRAPSEPGTRSSSSHSVPSMQFQVLLTCLSAFFSTFLRSTFPLSVFMSYLDLAEIYQLLYAEITINVTLKEDEIWKPLLSATRGFHPLWPSFPTEFRTTSAPPCIFLKRSIGLASVLSPDPFPLIFAFFVRHY